jgi:hypothetical protein
METTKKSPHGHRGPHPGIVAIVYTLLFNAALYQVISFTGAPHFPGPWDAMASLSCIPAIRRVFTATIGAAN